MAMLNGNVFDAGLTIAARLLVSEDPQASHEVVGSYRSGESWGALWRHRFEDGRVYEEAVQIIRSDEPMVLLALKDESGKWIRQSLWSEAATELVAQLCRL